MIALIPSLSETTAYINPDTSKTQGDFAKILQALGSQSNSSPPPPPPQYVVQAGDHLWGIAKKLGYSDPWALARVNNLKEPDRLKVGQVLQLPPGDTGTAASGLASLPTSPSRPSGAGKSNRTSFARLAQGSASASSPWAGGGPAVSQAGEGRGGNGVVVLASWYGENHHGRRMANGQPFDMYGDTVAHPHLPLGTRLRLTNPWNGRSVVVKVTDRGPFVGGRGLDISYGVARKLGVVKGGVTPLVMETV